MFWLWGLTIHGGLSVNSFSLSCRASLAALTIVHVDVISFVCAHDSGRSKGGGEGGQPFYDAKRVWLLTAGKKEAKALRVFNNKKRHIIGRCVDVITYLQPTGKKKPRKQTKNNTKIWYRSGLPAVGGDSFAVSLG